MLPEAADGGPLALVQDDDEIVVDIGERRLDLVIADVELADRRRRWLEKATASLEHGRTGWLSQYRDLVQPLDKGGVLRGNRVP